MLLVTHIKCHKSFLISLENIVGWSVLRWKCIIATLLLSDCPSSVVLSTWGAWGKTTMCEGAVNMWRKTSPHKNSITLKMQIRPGNDLTKMISHGPTTKRIKATCSNRRLFKLEDTTKQITAALLFQRVQKTASSPGSLLTLKLGNALADRSSAKRSPLEQ